MRLRAASPGVLAVLFGSCCLHAALCPAQTAIRIRLADGKSGKPFSPASVRVQPNTGEHVDYTITKADPAAVLVTLKSATSISVSGQFKSCEATKPDSPATSYTVEEILERGAVSSNTCGKIQAQPTKGELLLYVRQATRCESVQDVFRGVRFCD